ncbi:MAG: hypothetical protein LBS00_02735 [Synergistaceae bacterium]|jgi:hypothetical protein|nr:hypothetical protein [Synergistaceae bacterium]
MKLVSRNPRPDIVKALLDVGIELEEDSDWWSAWEKRLLLSDTDLSSAGDFQGKMMLKNRERRIFR